MIANDTTVFIERSIEAVFTTIAEAVVLVVLVTLVFLRSWRATLIPLVTIPISLIATFALLYAFGFSVNTLTLLALVLAIGLVVDDAIVVLENVHRHIEKGEPPLQAALIGTREIVFAVIAMTLTLAAVYAPIASRPRPHRPAVHRVRAGARRGGAGLGVRGADADAHDVLAAAAARDPREPGRPAYCAAALERLEAGYRRVLDAHAGASLGDRAAGRARARRRGRPVHRACRASWRLTRTAATCAPRCAGRKGRRSTGPRRNLAEIEPMLAAVPEAESTFVIAGVPEVTRGIAVLRLKPWEERERSQQEVAAELRTAVRPGSPAWWRCRPTRPRSARIRATRRCSS